ncbi:MAG: S-methyl-5-thioribose-1-phosphate isomerase [Candidatus Methanofastidiosia archaeon]
MTAAEFPRTIYFEEDNIKMIDQTKLPAVLQIHSCDNVNCLIEAIARLRVRGAPALGIAGAYGVLLSAIKNRNSDRNKFFDSIKADAQRLATTRPTAVNLGWAINIQLKILDKKISNEENIKALRKNAEEMAKKDIENNRKIGEFGNTLIGDDDSILTHCNAGALACAGYGTALGIIRSAHEAGKKIHVFIDETRPLCQGSRLTAWEMVCEKIPATLITDNMAGFLMQQKKIDKIIVGADRIASNGDVANKIGTYSLSILAKHHNIPLIVAAPTSTIDFSINNGSQIPIEFRDGMEIKTFLGVKNAPDEIDAYNPAFDITPAENIEAIITERGIAKRPFETSLRRFKS